MEEKAVRLLHLYEVRATVVYRVCEQTPNKAMDWVLRILQERLGRKVHIEFICATRERKRKAVTGGVIPDSL